MKTTKNAFIGLIKLTLVLVVISASYVVYSAISHYKETTAPTNEVSPKEKDDKAYYNQSLPESYSFATVERNTGCSSKNSDPKKEDLFNNFFKNRLFIWEGTIADISKTKLMLKMLKNTFASDLILHTKNNKTLERVIYDLQVGQKVTVKLKLKRLGGCGFSSYSGSLIEVY